MHIDRDSETGFDALLVLMAASPVRSLDIRCKCCPHLGDDEARLLQLVGSLQGGRLIEAAAILADWLSTGAVRGAFGPAQAFAAGLAGRGFMMPHHQAETTPRRSAVARAHACTSDLLH
jgi:hypothetical protein